MPVSAGREGGCQCAAIRYRLPRSPLALYACHCRDWQNQSASAFGMSVWVERDGIAFSGAAPRIFRTRGGSGIARHCAFCGECGYSPPASPRSLRSSGYTRIPGTLPASRSFWIPSQ